MAGQRDWVVPVPAQRYREERLYRRDRLVLPDVPGLVPPDGSGLVPPDVPGLVPPDGSGPVPGDRAVLVADLQPGLIFGWGRIVGPPAGPLVVIYERRLFDAPLPADDLRAGPLAPERFAEIRAAAGPPARAATWLVSVDLPVEAETPGEAVREFWSYLRELGPGELPAFVSPLHDELAMQAYVLGERTNLDPEADE